MSRRLAFLLWCVVTVALSAGTAWLVNRSFAQTDHAPQSPGTAAAADFHEWMHQQLHIDAEQEARLAPIEAEFAEARSRLLEEIATAGRDLAAAVRAGQPDSPGIDDALTRLNRAQAGLQRETLDHFFAMKQHLDPEQADRLLQWTHDRIIHE